MKVFAQTWNLGPNERNPLKVLSRFQAILLLVSVCLWGCASRQTIVKPQPIADIPAVPAPDLTDNQLMGLHKLRGLWKDDASGQFALKEVMESYWKLKEAAEKEGWNLMLVSGYRSFGSQRRIWNKNDRSLQKNGVEGEATRAKSIMRTVSVPGLSRHQWGTEVDISEKSLRGRLLSVGPDTPKRVLDFYDWMEENAPKYGFCRVYQGKKGSIVDEPWHWSYHPFARVYQEQFVRIKDFSGILNKDVAGIQYIIRNFGEIFEMAVKSVDSGCFPDHQK